MSFIFPGTLFCELPAIFLVLYITSSTHISLAEQCFTTRFLRRLYKCILSRSPGMQVLHNEHCLSEGIVLAKGKVANRNDKVQPSPVLQYNVRLTERLTKRLLVLYIVLDITMLFEYKKISINTALLYGLNTFIDLQTSRKLTQTQYCYSQHK